MFSFSCSRAISVAPALLLSLLLPVAAVADDAERALKVGESIYSQTCIACHGANGKGALGSAISRRPMGRWQRLMMNSRRAFATAS